MIAVLDVSAAIELVLTKRRSKEIGSIIADADLVLAPELYVVEAANVLWKYHHFHDLPLPESENALQKAVALVDQYVPASDFYREAFALACATRLPAYDMFYLVLARRNSAVLLTLDQTLRTVAKKQGVKII